MDRGTLLFMILYGVVILIILLILIEIIREHHSFQIQDYTVSSHKLMGLKEEVKIAFISDLHNQTYGKHNQKLLDALRLCDPDLILIGGDIVTAKHHRFRKKVNVRMDKALRLLKDLPQIAPVYLAHGNHEQRLKELPDKYPGYEKFRETIQRAGITYLENNSELVFIKGKSIRLTGYELPTNFNKEKERKQLLKERIYDDLGHADRRNYTVLLAHDPQYLNIYADWGADLSLCGHLHGGLIRIPGWRGMVTPAGKFFPKHSGELSYRQGVDGPVAAIVSRGLGIHTLPIRLFNTPELVVVHLTASI